jgi:putative transposase
LASRRSLSENRWPHAYLWHAVDAEGDVLDVLVQAKRNKRAALKLMLKLLKKYGFPPETLVTDELRSYQPPRANLGSRIGIAPADGETIGPRIRINRPGDENARCKVSRAPGQRKDFSQSTPRSTTNSTPNATSS